MTSVWPFQFESNTKGITGNAHQDEVTETGRCEWGTVRVCCKELHPLAFAIQGKHIKYAIDIMRSYSNTQKQF